MSTMSYMSTYMSHICQQSIRKVERKNVSFLVIYLHSNKSRSSSNHILKSSERHYLPVEMKSYSFLSFKTKSPTCSF